MVAVGRRRMGIVTLIRGSGLGIRSLFGDGYGDGGLVGIGGIEGISMAFGE